MNNLVFFCSRGIDEQGHVRETMRFHILRARIGILTIEFNNVQHRFDRFSRRKNRPSVKTWFAF